MDEAKGLSNALWAKCGDAFFYGEVRIALDANGHASSVYSNPASTYLEQCILGALQGLTFPCLANFEVCPLHVIAE